jgi:hypothetical protein
MQSAFFWLAALSSLVTFAVHTFIGGVVVARPLLADTGLPKASRWLNYYCWHIATVLLLAIAGAFAYAAVRTQALELAWFATALSLALSLLSAAVARKGRIHPLRFPSTSLFALIAALGLGGLTG